MRAFIRHGTLGTLATTAWLFLSGTLLYSQEGPPPGNFDPAQMRQRQMQRLRETFEVSDDAEWRAIADRLDKLMELRRAAGGFGGPGGGPPPMAGGGPSGGLPGNARRPGPQGPPDNPDNPDRPGPLAGPGPGAPGGPGALGGQGGPGGFRPPSDPNTDALRKAIAAKAPAAELKAQIAELKALRARKQAELEQAQEQLRKLLTTRQEAIAVMMGLL